MIRTGLRTLKEYVFKTVASTQARSFLLVLFVAVAVIFGATHSARADISDEASKWLLGQLGLILGTIIDFLGKMVVLLSNILIDISSYNNFVHAQPVEIGWVLIRDVVNMFFIVILLVSAFSTIIGYEEFKYTKVLPKLLLMAVLINFSKTLIGLLIDFSQVLMLTFVNAFKPAAGGNFISLFKLTKLVNMKADALPDLSQLLVASMLAILMLSIVMTILIIMIGFMLYRIIGLWMILIMSPLAFFALALPGKISGALSVFTSKFWKDLSTFLVAGPVMAFFIWMALAMAQGGSAFGELTNRTNTETESVNSFISAIGSVEQMGGFIVAVAFLLTGVQFAMSTANSVSPILGSLGKAVGGASVLGAVPSLARGLYRGGRLAGRAAGTAASGTYRTADVISGRRISAGVGSAVSGIGKAALKVNPGGLGEASFVQMAAYNKKRLQKKNAEREKNLAPLDAGARDAYNRRASSAWNVERQQFATMSLAETATTGPGLKARTKAFEDELAKSKSEMSAPDRAALATAMARQQAAEDIAKGKAMAEGIGDGAAVTRFKEALEKDPGLHTDLTELASIKGAAPYDIKRYIDKIPDKAMQDGAVAVAHMKALGMVGDDGKIIRNEGNEDTWKSMMKGSRGKYLQSHLDAYASPGHENDMQNILKAIDGNLKVTKDGKEVVDTDAIAATRHYAAMKGGAVGSAFVGSGTGTSGMGAPIIQNVQQTVNQQKIDEGHQRLQKYQAGNVSMASPEAQAAQRDMLSGGATLAQAVNFNQQSGEFATKDHRDAFAGIVSKLDGDLKNKSTEALELVMNLDTGSLREDGARGNEARSMLVSGLSPTALQSAYEEANQTGNKQAVQKLGELTSIIEAEGKRSEKILSDLGVTREEIKFVHGKESGQVLDSVMQKLQTEGKMDKAKAQQTLNSAAIAHAITNSEEFRALRSSVSPEAMKKAQRIGGRKGDLSEKRKNDKKNKNG